MFFANPDGPFSLRLHGVVVGGCQEDCNVVLLTKCLERSGLIKLPINSKFANAESSGVDELAKKGLGFLTCRHR